MSFRWMTYGQLLDNIDPRRVGELEDILCGELEMNYEELRDTEITHTEVLEWCMQEIGL